MSKKVLYIQYTNPAMYPPLEHSSAILADKGWQVLFLGITPLGDSQVLRFPDHPHIQVQQLPPVPIGWRQKLHYLYFTLWVLLKTIRWQPDWVYASDLFSSPAALLLSLFPDLKIAYHEHDTPDENGTSLFIRILLATRKRLAKQADICILPNEQRAQHFSVTLMPKYCPLIVWNCPRKEEVLLGKYKKDLNGLTIWYHGSIVPGRPPISLLYAIASLPENISLYVAGYTTTGHPGYVDQLKSIVTDLDISNRVFFLPSMPRFQLLQQCRKHDVGIAFISNEFENINMQYLVGASNKPFDYLTCGLALLVSNLQDWEELYVENGYGLACNPDDPESIATALRWFWEHPQERKAMGEQGQLRVREEWNYETQFEPVLALMQGQQV